MEPRAQRHTIDAQFRCRLAFGIVGFLGVPGQRLENFFRAHSRCKAIGTSGEHKTELACANTRRLSSRTPVTQLN